MTTRKTLLIVWFLVAVAYLPSLRGGFLTDDLRMMESSFTIQSMGDLWLSIRTGYDFDPARGGPPTDTLFNTYRPLPITTLLLLKTWAGTNTLPYHVVNLLLHLVAVTLAFFLVCQWLSSGWSRLLAVSLFALHPFVPDAVAWINGLSDPFAFIFMAGAILSVRRGADGMVPFLWVAVFSFLAMLCKETSFVLLLLLPLVSAEANHSRRRVFGFGVSFFVVFLVVTGIRFSSLGEMEVESSKMLAGNYLLEFPLFVLETPFRLLSFFTPHVVMLKEEWFLVRVVPIWAAWILAPLFYLGGMWLYGEALWKRNCSAYRLFVLAFVLFLAPVFYVYGFKYISPRMFYPAILWMGLCFGLLLERNALSGPQLQRISKIVILVFVPLLFASTLERSLAYRGPLELWRAETENNPSSPYGYHFLASNLIKRGRFDEALPIVKRASRLDPGAVEVQNNLGVCYLNMGLLEEAKKVFEKLALQTSQNCKAYYHLALIAKLQGRFFEARSRVEEALRFCPRYGRAIALRREIGSSN